MVSRWESLIAAMRSGGIQDTESDIEAYMSSTLYVSGSRASSIAEHLNDGETRILKEHCFLIQTHL
jgi:hypothetical protein